MRIVAAYVPVLHKAYLDFLLGQRADAIYVVGKELTVGIRSVKKDLRALDPEEAMDALSGFALVRILDLDTIRHFIRTGAEVVMPDDEVSAELVASYFGEYPVELKPVFLRWDINTSTREHEVDADEVVSVNDLDRLLMGKVIEFSKRSTDWWRHVAAVAVVNGEIAHCAYNHAVPHQDLPLYEGDPRGSFRQGIMIEASLVLHAEAAIVSEAAKRGPRLEGAKLYVSTFPCPPCAKLLAYSGISELYYAEGYAVIDGERILKDNNVKITRVQM